MTNNTRNQTNTERSYSNQGRKNLRSDHDFNDQGSTSGGRALQERTPERGWHGDSEGKPETKSGREISKD